MDEYGGMPNTGMADSPVASNNCEEQVPMVAPDDECSTRQPFGLLDLPPELKIMVYEAILSKFEKKSWEKVRRAKDIQGVFAQLPVHLVQILLTCKAMWCDLLPLVFDAFVWVVDIRYQHGNLSPFTIIPQNNWILQPSTMAKPTSGNIRRASFRLQFKVPRSDSDWALARRDLNFAQIARHVHWGVHVQLVKTRPFYITTVECRAFRTGTWGAEVEAKSHYLHGKLEEAAVATLDGIIERKGESDQAACRFTIEDWRLLASKLQTSFQEWFDEDDWRPQAT